MKDYLLLFMVLLCFNSKTVLSQEIVLTAKDSVTHASWNVGLGYTIIDDSSTPVGQDLFNIKDTWNALAYPTRVSLGRSFGKGFGLELSGSYNRYKVGKLVDGQINTAARNYLAFDALIRYDIDRIMGNMNWFDPYLQIGGGYSTIGAIGRSTFNAGFGFNIWLGDHLGVNLNTMGKWGLPKGSTRQLQHSVGMIYQWGVERGLSKKGLEKKTLMLALEEEAQKRQDSIALADLEEERARLLIEKEVRARKEAFRLAQIDEKRVAEQERRSAIENELRAIGHAYFDLNSSYLNAESKSKLDKIARLLLNHPSVALMLTSHTDARGADKYNQWLSERRVKRTLDYLISKGIAEERLKAKAFGEKVLTNECDNVTVCTEGKHRANRRTEFRINSF